MERRNRSSHCHCRVVDSPIRVRYLDDSKRHDNRELDHHDESSKVQDVTRQVSSCDAGRKFNNRDSPSLHN